MKDESASAGCLQMEIQVKDLADDSKELSHEKEATAPALVPKITAITQEQVRMHGCGTRRL